MRPTDKLAPLVESHAMETLSGVEVGLHAFLNYALDQEFVMLGAERRQRNIF
jgi:hypothetical protein